MKLVAILDDHAVVRTGLKFLLKDEANFEVVLSVAQADAVYDYLEKGHHIDVLILDLHMPNANGFDLLKKLKTRFKYVQVIVFSMDEEHSSALISHRLGALAYINKQDDPHEIVRAAKFVIEGRRYFTLSQSNWLPDELQLVHESSDLAHECLSPRQFQIFQELISGKCNKQIAQSLHISPNTLSNHRANILKKLHLSTNHDLIRYAFDHGYIQ